MGAFSEALRAELKVRQSLNPRYSLRSFARSLRLPVGRLSEILSEKRRPSAQIIQQVVDRMRFRPELAEHLLLSSLREKASGRTKFTRRAQLSSFSMAEDQFRVIADWHHLAVYSLIECYPSASLRELSLRLGIPVKAVRAARERLERLSLINRTPGGWIVRYQEVVADPKIASLAIRTAHEQYLSQAMKALHELDVNERDFRAVTVATTPEKFKKACTKIQRFMKNLMRELETGDKTDVFRIQIQGIPLTRSRKRKKEILP